MTEDASCVGRKEYEGVFNADTTGAVRPCSPDGHGTGGRRLLGTLPEMRHRRTCAGNVRRSAAGAVGAGTAKQEKVALSCSRSTLMASPRLALAAEQVGAGGPGEKR
jgi:hypothetical protein